ncbi:MAG: Gfo/Idh/MocA family oxidoreductase [Anaerolineae bacterium]|nr:Gfo/Idh/MocA family oxidoreductase [Anaerolineae bacterium]
MTTYQEQRSKALSLDPKFDYLPETDRYLTQMPDTRHRINVIGTGMIGQEHIAVTHMEESATVHGIYDPNPGSVEAAQAVHARYEPNTPLVVHDTLEAACNDPDADALIISTPNYTHLDVLRVAAKSGKHILLEKPIATTLHDAVEITRIAEDYGAVFQLGLQYRYKAIAVESIFEVLKRNAIGDVLTVSMVEHRIPFLDKVNQWNKFAKYSGDTLVEKCCHYFDLLNLFAQSRPKTVYASGGMAVNFREFEYNGEKSDILDNAFVVIEYENGVRAALNLVMFAPMFYEELMVCGDSGRLRAWEQQDYLSGMELKNNVEIYCGEDRTSRTIQPGYPSWIEKSGHGGATYTEHVKLIDNMDGKPTNTATAQEGLWCVIVALAGQESIKRGQVVNVNEYLASNGVEI